MDVPRGTTRKVLDVVPFAMSSEPRVYAVGTSRSGQNKGMSLFTDSSKSPLITLGTDSPSSSIVGFDVSATRLAWGNADGTVTVCNLSEIQNRLRRAALSW